MGWFLHPLPSPLVLVVRRNKTYIIKLRDKMSLRIWKIKSRQKAYIKLILDCGLLMLLFIIVYKNVDNSNINFLFAEIYLGSLTTK